LVDALNCCYGGKCPATTCKENSNKLSPQNKKEKKNTKRENSYKGGQKRKETWTKVVVQKSACHLFD